MEGKNNERVNHNVSSTDGNVTSHHRRVGKEEEKEK